MKHVEKCLTLIKLSVNYTYYYHGCNVMFYSVAMPQYKFPIKVEDMTLSAQAGK